MTTTCNLIHGILLKHLVPTGIYQYGFASLNGLLPEKYRELPGGISICRKLDDRILDEISDAPTMPYYLHYREINEELSDLSEKITDELKYNGISALVIRPTIATGSREFDQYLPTLRYEVSQKMIATRAGLGWIGKTDLFISRKFGARLRLGSILIDREVLPERKPIDRSLCGKCRICVDKCPANAATGQLWDIHTDRDLFFDAFKCREQCTKFGKSVLKNDKRICGICVAVCPVGRVRPATA